MRYMNNDINVGAGSNAPAVVWQFLQNDVADDATPIAADLFPLTGDFYLAIVWDGGRIDKNTVDDSSQLTVDAGNSKLMWFPTIAETRLLPPGRIARWEIENRISEVQQPFGSGYVVVEGGLNLD